MINSWIFVVFSCFPPFLWFFWKRCANFVPHRSKVQHSVYIFGIFSSYSCEIQPISATQLVCKTGSFRWCYVNMVCWVDIRCGGLSIERNQKPLAPEITLAVTHHDRKKQVEVKRSSRANPHEIRLFSGCPYYSTLPMNGNHNSFAQNIR